MLRLQFEASLTCVTQEIELTGKPPNSARDAMRCDTPTWPVMQKE
jgi:hypothetical protein